MVKPVFKSKAVSYENSDSNVCLIICSLNQWIYKLEIKLISCYIWIIHIYYVNIEYMYYMTYIT